LGLDEEDPYWSEMENSDEEVVKEDNEEREQQRILAMLKKEKQKPKKVSTPISRPLSPQVKREATTPTHEEPLSKRTKVLRSKAKIDVPPPPSAKQVVREIEKQRRKLSRASSHSPPPRSDSASPPYIPQASSPLQVSSTPLATSSTPDDGLMTEADIVNYMNTASGPVTAKLVVSAMKSLLEKDARNKERLKGIMKKTLAYDKATGLVNLKDEYK
jgi:hypothetical protein